MKKTFAVVVGLMGLSAGCNPSTLWPFSDAGGGGMSSTSGTGGHGGTNTGGSGGTAVDSSFRPAALMHSQRCAHTATLLDDGHVLLAGGASDSGIIADSEVYLPDADQWDVKSPMQTARGYHTATLLDDGTVLVTGGMNVETVPLSTAEIYDPAKAQWTLVEQPMKAPHHSHTATKLPNGNVLVIGGVLNENGAPEVYNHLTKTWNPTPPMGAVRQGHTATLLPSGKVLIVGGTALGPNGSSDVPSAELYDPSAGPWGAWTSAGAMSAPRSAHTATLLPDGSVLIAGGVNGSTPLSSTEIYHPGSGGPTGQWVSPAGTGEAMNVPRYTHTATLLPNGKVLVTGGRFTHADLYDSAELFDPSLLSWTPTNPPNMETVRAEHTATLLANGAVLLAGGWKIGPLCERYSSH
ncbi:MAG: kelch repeat-containing protein [Byssovorax sp.]